MHDEIMIKTISDSVISSLKAEKLTLKDAVHMIAIGEAKAQAIGIPMVLTILDDSGNLIAQHRMDDALLVSIQASYAKAYTAVSLRRTTAEAALDIMPGKALYGLPPSRPDFCFLGGGIPLIRNGRCIGGLGVSGGTIEQDLMIAEYIMQKSAIS
ncbi:MAG: GlcG/HbpS family heme-binding protein [Lachnospiraceae bacterium]